MTPYKKTIGKKTTKLSTRRTKRDRRKDPPLTKGISF
jgi:hypothetical protein